jgi:hypothetical protein
MSKMKRLIVASVLALGACAPTAGDITGDSAFEGDEISDLAFLETALKCQVGKPCGGDGDGDDGGDEGPDPAAPKVSLAYDAAAKRVTVTWPNVPANAAVTVSYQLSIDWSCSQGPAPGPKTVLGTVPASASAKKLVHENVPDDARVFYFVSYKKANGATVELSSNFDTKIVKPRGTAKLEVTGFDKRWVSLKWVDQFVTDDYLALERAVGSWSESFSEVKRFDSTHNVTCKGFAHQDHGAPPGSTVCYRVRIHTTLGHTGYTPKVCQETLELELPPAPKNVNAVSGEEFRMNVTWEYSGSNHDGFQIDVDGMDYDSKTVGRDARSFVVKGGTPGKTYTVKVRAYNEDGSSSWSSDEATPGGEPPMICSGGATPKQYAFCQICPGNNTDTTHTHYAWGCTKEEARQSVQVQGSNCEVEDGVCD